MGFARAQEDPGHSDIVSIIPSPLSSPVDYAGQEMSMIWHDISPSFWKDPNQLLAPFLNIIWVSTEYGPWV